VAGLLAGWGFVPAGQARAWPIPLIDLRLFGRPGFRTALVVNTLVYFVILGMLLLVSQYLQLVARPCPRCERACGWLPTMAGLVGGSLVESAVSYAGCTRRFAMAAGLAVAAAGFGLPHPDLLSLGLPARGDRVGGVFAGRPGPGDQPGGSGLVLASAPPESARSGFGAVRDQH